MTCPSEDGSVRKLTAPQHILLPPVRESQLRGSRLPRRLPDSCQRLAESFRRQDRRISASAGISSVEQKY